MGRGRGIDDGDSWFKPVTAEWFDGTTLHGLPRAFKGEPVHPVRRAFWIILFSAALAVFIVLITGLIKDYLKYNTNTSVSLKYARSLDFPVVTFCNNNAYNATAIDEAIAAGVTLPDDLAVLVANFSVPFDEFIIRCEFNKRNCTSKDFVPLLHPRYGICWQFNKEGTVRKSGRPGVEFGLAVNFKLNQDDYSSDTEEAGVVVAVNSRSRPTLPEQEGIALSPGVTSFVSVVRTQVKNQKKPYGECEDGAATGNTINGLYSVAGCFLICRDRHVISRCGCRQDLSYVSTGGVRRCALDYDQNDDGDWVPTSPDAICYEKAIAEYDAEQVTCNCPDPCDDEFYSLASSQMAYPSESVVRSYVAASGGDPSNAAEREAMYQRLSRDYLTVTLYYPELNFEYIETNPATTWQALLGNIGGNLGMFVGASICTVLEVGELIYWLIRAYVRARRERFVGDGAKRPSEQPVLEMESMGRA